MNTLSKNKYKKTLRNLRAVLNLWDNVVFRLVEYLLNMICLKLKILYQILHNKFLGNNRSFPRSNRIIKNDPIFS